jgi:hypothetical protein
MRDLSEERDNGGRCNKCLGRGYKVMRLSEDSVNFPDPYIPFVTKITRIQPCTACNSTGRADKRHIDNQLLKVIFG